MADSPLHWVRMTADDDWQVAQRNHDGDGWLVIGVPTPVHPAVVGERVQMTLPGGSRSSSAEHVRSSPMALATEIIAVASGERLPDRGAIERRLGITVDDDAWSKAVGIASPFVRRRHNDADTSGTRETHNDEGIERIADNADGSGSQTDQAAPERAEVAARLAAHRAATGERTIGVEAARVLAGNLLAGYDHSLHGHDDTDTRITESDRNRIRARIRFEAKNFGLSLEEAAKIEILGYVPIIWSNWECHSGAALLRLPDGRLRWFVLDDVDRSGQSVVEMLRERAGVYAEMLERTCAMLTLAEEVQKGGAPIWDAVRDGTDEDPR